MLVKNPLGFKIAYSLKEPFSLFTNDKFAQDPNFYCGPSPKFGSGLR